MSIVIATPSFYSAFDANGNPLAGGKVYTYLAGTLTPRATYTDQGGTTPNANPVILDSAGRANIWLDDSASYKFVVTDSADTPIRTTDNVAPFSTAAGLSVLGSIASNTLVGNNTGASATPTALTIAQVQAMIGSTFSHNSITGFLPSSIAGTATTATLTISTGQAADSTNASLFAKATTTSWAVTNGNAANGYQGGTTLPNSTTIHFYAIALPTDTSWTASFASLSLTPTLPGSYTRFRRLFSLRTSAAGALLNTVMIEAEGGGIIAWLGTATLDISTAALSTSRVAYPLNVPAGIKVQPFIRANIANNVGVILTSGDETDVAPGTYGATWTLVPGYDLSVGSNSMVGSTYLTTNTSGEIGARATGVASLYLVTRGWKDFRRS